VTALDPVLGYEKSAAIAKEALVTNRSVKVLLHDMSSDEILDGLHNGGLQLAVTVWPSAEYHPDVEFESLKTYPVCAALSASHPLARLKTIPLEKIAVEPLITLNRKKYPDAQSMLEKLFQSLGVKPRSAPECACERSQKGWGTINDNVTQ
jgi:LysR family transcriptional regulator, benzoate and cis,cis-muconate-responsive activator of ben and cat genes